MGKTILNIEEINNTDHLRQLAGIWNDILSESESDTIFLTWEWIFNWWQAYGKNKKLFVLILKDQHRHIIGIAPLYIRRKKIFKSFWVSEVRFLGTGEDVGPDYLDLIIKKGREEEAINKFMEYLYSKDGWNILNLTDILSTSLTTKILPQVASRYGLMVKSSDCAICPYIQLPSSWEEYLSGLSKNMRYNIKRRITNLEKKFKVRYFFWQDFERLNHAIEKLASLHKKRWEERSSYCAFSSKEFNAFQQAVARDFALKGWLQLCCLELDGEITGMFYDFCYKNKIYYFQGGFEPSFSAYSIGLVLRAYIIRKAIEISVKEMDLLKGAYEHKYRWTPFDRHTINLTIGKNCFPSKLFFFEVFEKPKIKAAVKKVLPDSLLRIIKRVRKTIHR